jgi:hypothetical protein
MQRPRLGRTAKRENGILFMNLSLPKMPCLLGLKKALSIRRTSSVARGILIITQRNRIRKSLKTEHTEEGDDDEDIVLSIFAQDVSSGDLPSGHKYWRSTHLSGRVGISYVERDSEQEKEMRPGKMRLKRSKQVS